tara:strand:+ start:1246 stop:2358 length:1113 start_codon:yes stop_codon:yes gene_type:complete
MPIQLLCSINVGFMNQLKSLTEVDKIESMFVDDINFYPIKEVGKKKPIRKIRIEHLYWIPSLIYSRIYGVFPRILKDIFFYLSIIHKSPSSKLFAKTRYDELRTLIDIKVSALALNRVPTSALDKVKETFNKGSYSTNLLNLSELDILINDVVNYANPSHAGARPYFKDGKNKKLEGSFSAYYTFSKKDNKKLNLIFSKSLDEDFNYHLSALAGYSCTLEDISYSLSIVYGENSNSEMHQDTYASLAKGFIYLQDVDYGNSPFEYLEGSYLDATYRSNETNKAVLNNDTSSSGSTRLRGRELQDAFKKYKLKTFTGSKGLFVLANTAGYHRKGAHNSNKPRIILACEVKRKGVFSKLIINLLRGIRLKKT